MLQANETVSVVNRHTVGGKSEYFVRIIHGCSWYWKDSVVAGATGIQRIRSLRCRIPACAAGASGYVIPQEWKTLSPAERADHWTLQPGDLICRGELTEVSPGQFNSLPSQMEAATIRAVRDNRRGAMQHWAVVGE